MRVCLLTCNARHSAAGERIAALAERVGDVTIVQTGSEDWAGAVPIDELSGSFDAAVAVGWQACLHVFRPDAERYAYYVPAMQDALLWHGDERRMLAALTYDLPLTLIAPSRALARALEERAPGRQVVVVERGVARGATPGPGDGTLRISGAPPEVLERMGEPHVASREPDVLVELNAADQPLAGAPAAMAAGVVPVVTPADGHDELITDGENGIVVGFDDVPGTARALDTLARDSELLARLREGALRRAESLPTPDGEAKALLEALSASAPATDAWPARLLLNARAVMEPVSQERQLLEEALRSYEERIANLTSDNERLRAELDEARRGLLGRLRAKTASGRDG